MEGIVSGGRVEVAKSQLRGFALGLAVGALSRRTRSRLGVLLGRHGVNETDLLVSLSQGIERGRLVDVGARYGTAAEPFLRRNWEVLAFEPDRESRVVLKWVARLLGRLTIDPRGVSDRDHSEAILYRSPGRSAISSLVPFHESHEPGESISLVSLSSAFREHAIPDVDVLKVDAEGHDLSVIRGFPWDAVEPKLVMCEFDQGKVSAGGHGFHELVEEFVGRGYRVLVSEWHPIEKYSGRHRWRRLTEAPCELLDDMAHGNIIAHKNLPDEQTRLEDIVSTWVEIMERSDQ